MRVTVAAVGKLKAGPERDLFDRYWKRFEASGRAAGITGVRLIELSESRAARAVDRAIDEATRLAAAIGEDRVLVALDEKGKAFSSEAFAAQMRRWAEDGRADVAFAIGGPDGHGARVVETSALRLSLGLMTLPHGLARVVLAEQLYRAVTILTGHPYHRAG